MKEFKIPAKQIEVEQRRRLAFGISLLIKCILTIKTSLYKPWGLTPANCQIVLPNGKICYDDIAALQFQNCMHCLNFEKKQEQWK